METTTNLTVQPEISLAASPILDLPIAAFQIVQSSEMVTESYPYRSDVEPKLEQNKEGVFIFTLHTQGEHGKFDKTYISNHIVYADEELVAILVGYHGTETWGSKKNNHVKKGQFWRFYQRLDDGIWQQVDWKHLNDATRQTVLDAKVEHAPEWAKEPGKLTSQYKEPKKRVKMISYKLVQIIEGRYYSIYKPSVEYVIGEKKQEQARPGHRGGFFSYPKAERVLELFHAGTLFRRSCYREPLQVALLECQIEGRIIEYSNGKWASTFLTPLRVIETFEYSPN